MSYRMTNETDRKMSTAQKGLLGETEMKTWLDTQNLGYLYISQSQKDYPSLFKGRLKDGKIKRPDFLVLFESIGMIAVDVKYRTEIKMDESGEFHLTPEQKSEVQKVISFERLFRMPVWYAYHVKDHECWYWISALKVIECGTISDKGFYQIAMKHFEEVRVNADLAKLYTHRLAE